MRLTRWPLASLIAVALIFVAAVGANAEDSPADTLDKSAGWGIDRDSGQVAIDAQLLVFWDPVHRTLVINPGHEAEAAAAVEAEVQADGTWLMPDGSVVTPIQGQVKVLTGEEPAEARPAPGEPTTSVSRVDLTTEIGAGAIQARLFSRCRGCYACPRGCEGALQWLPAPNYRTCESALFSTCKRTWRPVCPVDEHACIGCTGGVVASGALYAWSCGVC